MIALVLVSCSESSPSPPSPSPTLTPATVSSFSPVFSPAISPRPSPTPPVLEMEPVGVPSEDDAFTVWPEDDPLAARATEANQPPSWRADPKEVVRHFGVEVLGWPDAEVRLVAGERCRHPCADLLRAPGEDAGAIVEVIRIFDDLWSVIAVRRLGHAGVEQHIYDLAVNGRHVEGAFDGLQPLAIELTVTFSGRSVTQVADAEAVSLELPEAPTRPGHYVVRYLDADGLVAGTEARALPAGDSRTGT